MNKYLLLAVMSVILSFECNAIKSFKKVSFQYISQAEVNSIAKIIRRLQNVGKWSEAKKQYDTFLNQFKDNVTKSTVKKRLHTALDKIPLQLSNLKHSLLNHTVEDLNNSIKKDKQKRYSSSKEYTEIKGQQVATEATGSGANSTHKGQGATRLDNSGTFSRRPPTIRTTTNNYQRILIPKRKKKKPVSTSESRRIREK